VAKQSQSHVKAMPESGSVAKQSQYHVKAMQVREHMKSESASMAKRSERG